MLKKYYDFIKEDIKEIEHIHHTLGEWVEELCLKNKEIEEILRPYLDNTNPTVRISNIINTLEEYDRKSVYKLITDYLNGAGRKGEIITYIDLTNESTNTQIEDLKAGKNVFNSFLKVITSLGLKDTEPNWKSMPESFILIFEYNTDSTKLKERFNRFPSLSYFTNKIPSNTKLYFGIKDTMEFSFGFIEEKIISIGAFQLNNAAFKFLQLLESQSANHLKKELAYLSIDKLKLLCSIAKHMKTYHPGDTSERSFKLNNGILEFGYKGLTKNIQEVITIKENFRKYLQTLRGSENLQMAITPSDDWVYCAIKIK